MQCWLACYPRPMRCVHDRGLEFIGSALQWLLNIFSVKDVQSISKNLQSNFIYKGKHQTTGNVLRTLLHGNPPLNSTQACNIIDQALANAMHAIRTTIMTRLSEINRSLSFNRHMFLNITLVLDWQAITKHQEQHIIYDLHHANRKQCQYDYALGQQVLKKMHDPTKLGVRNSGPYNIEQGYFNGTLTIELQSGVTKRINICCLTPYCL